MESLAQIPPPLPLDDQSPVTTKRGRGRPRLQKPGLSLTPKLRPRRNPRSQPPPPITSRKYQEGDLVWAQVDTQPPWWPGRVGSQRNEVGSTVVFLFGSASPAVAWCDPPQLKPFRDEFDPMVRQSVAPPFVDAVRAAMEVSAEGQFGNFLPGVFLSRVRDVSVDVFSCGLLEAAHLRTWIYGLVREFGVKVVNLADLLEADVTENKNMVGKGPEIMDVMSPGKKKKKRSLAELTAVPSPDMGREEVPEASRKHKEVGNIALPSVEIGAGVSEEDIGSPRTRDRKKSKYLSPPYTIESGYSTRSNSSKDVEVDLPKDGVAAEAEATEKVEIQMIPSFNYASTSADVMLSHLLRAAIDPLKPNSSAVAIRSFFEESRKLSSRGAGFENYLKELVASGNFNRKTMNDIVDKLEEEEGKSAEKSIVVEVGASEQAALSTGNDARKRGRPRKVQSIDGDPMNLGHPIDNDSQVNYALSTEQVNTRQERIERRGLANGGAALFDFGRNVTELSTSGQKRKSSNEASNGGIQSPNLVGTVANHIAGQASRQVRRKKEGTIATPLSEPKAPLPYVRENLEKMILALAGSSGVVLAQDLEPETKDYLIYEIHSLLNKVKTLQTGNHGTST